MTNVRNVPKLRFPEFREALPWSIKQLKQVCAVNPATSELPEVFAYIDLESVEAGELKAKKIISREESPSRAQRLLNYGDVIFQIVRPYQRNNFYFRIHDDIKYVASTGYAQLRAFESKDFLFQAIHTDDFVEKVIAKCTGSSYPAINSSDLAEISVAIPKPIEQHKIADCLASLDELITLEAQKLAALKTHKKGLMQQLFPAEGETVPKLRFPEFRDAGEWDIKTLSELAENLDNRRIPVTESDRVKGAIPYYGASGIVDYIHDFIFDEELLCISEDGANLVARSTPIAFSISGKTWVNNHAHVLKFERRCVQKIVEDYLNSISLEDYLTGMAQPKLNRAMLDTIPVPIPRDECEQQKVADCLSSLDDLIDAQSQKLAALKVHKKGLMQQLFPSMEAEV
ncbi:MAG: restriction endonuclease subunit S [Candidatus Competibacteraceae bacterium]|nr:restriction endonuclease subunit S [Candidatus Competibacteraceae bacterium]